MSLQEAIKAGNLMEAKKLIKHGVDLNQMNPGFNLFPIEQAANEGYIEIFRTLLKAGAKHQNTLVYAVKANQIEIAQALLDAETDVDIRDITEEFRGWTPLMHASYLGHIKLVKMLLQAGVNLEICDPQGRTALTLAVQFSRNLVVSALIKAGANINHRDYDGSSILSYACKGRSQWVLDQLRQAGVSQDGVREIVLVEAAGKGDLRTVKALLKAGVEVNAKNTLGITALEKACREGHIKIVVALLQAGADVNLRSGGFTPLMRASYYGHFKLVQMLINAGADLNATNSDIDALTYAQSNGHSRIVELLQQVIAERQQEVEID